MAQPTKTTQPDLHKSEQGVLNRSFDDTYNVLTQLLLAEYNNALYRLQVDASGNLKTTATIDPTGLATTTTDTNTTAISTNLGAIADTSATSDTGSFSLISLFKRMLEKMTTLVAKDFSTETTLAALNTKIPTAPATAANQQTDALTDTQLRATAVPVSGTVTAELSAADNSVLDDISTDTGNIDTNAGATTDAASTAGGTGSISAKLRLITTQLNTLDGNTNGIETLLAAIAAYVDGLETDTGAIKTAIDAINAKDVML